MGEGGCEIVGDVGVVVQIALAVLVGLVLMTEYLVEYLKSICSTNQSKRSFRTFWFDSYKICAGALVSHIFNIVVSISIDKLSGGNADQCAIYALAFFYEACGVPFVQLLQYGVIQYAKKMASQSSSVIDHESSINGSERHLASIDIDDACRQRWQWISKPGIYDANRYPVDDCLHCRSCQERDAKCNYIKIAVIMALATAVSVLGGFFGFKFYGSEWYVDVSLGFLFFVFILSTAIAPVSSLWQTMQWCTVKLFEKSIWSMFAMAQAGVFGRWSELMSTGDSTLDAWLYIAIVPIIMNAFMFFMFSRISRLKLPCFAPKDLDRLEKEREIHESSLLQGQSGGDQHLLNQGSMPALSHSFVDMKFDKKEAFKVGVIFMLMINITLLIIASTFLGFKGALESIWILFLSMIIAPTICSILGIYFFGYIIDNNVHLCKCCVDSRNLRKKQSANGSMNNGPRVYMDLDDLTNTRKL